MHDRASPSTEQRWTWRLLAASLILASAALHIAYLVHDCPLDLAPDEAHYWDWSRHLDWSYYSKGPLVALLIRASCEVFGPLSESLTGNVALAVRLPAVICGSLLLVSVYVLTVLSFGRERLAFGVVALALTLPPVAAMSTLMTIDSPYAACWGWALVFGHCAAVRQRAWAWPIAGIFVGIGILAKYTMVLWLPSVGLFLLMSSEHRNQLFQRGFWIACFLAAVSCLPILYWNYRNEWVTIRHVSGQAGVEQHVGWRWLGPLTYVGGQAALLFGVWFCAWVCAMWANRPWRVFEPDRRYLWCLSAPMFFVFLITSLKAPGQMNWPVTAYLSGGVLAADWIATQWTSPRLAMRRMVRWSTVSAAALGAVITVVVHYPQISRPVFEAVVGRPTAAHPYPMRRIDPTCRLRGWRALAGEVDRIRAELVESGEDPVIAASVWTIPGQLAAYGAGHPNVYSIGLAFGDRRCQYDFWRPNPVWDPETFRGRTFVLIGYFDNDRIVSFDSAGPRQIFVYQEGDQPIAAWFITVARGFRGFGPVEPLLRAARH